MLWVIGIEEKESCSKDIEYIFKRAITKDSQLGKRIPIQTQNLRHQTTKSKKEPLSSNTEDDIESILEAARGNIKPHIKAGTSEYQITLLG